MSEFPEFPPEYRDRWIESGLWLDRTLDDFFTEAVEAAPESEAIVFPEGRERETRPYLERCSRGDEYRITFADWRDLADDLAAGLLSRGIGCVDVVSVQLPNWPEMCLLQVALARIGAVIQPMHVTYREQEIRSMLEFCESKAVFLPSGFGRFDYATAVEGFRADLPDLEHVFVVGPEHASGVAFSELMRGGEGQRARIAEHDRQHPPSADRVFYLNFTSGTTGTPKGFLHTSNSLLSTLKRFVDLQAEFDPKASETVVLANSPMTHSYGHLTTHQTILLRSKMVLVSKFDPRETLRIIERERVTSLSGTPAHFIALLDHPAFETTDASTVRSVGVGGAACPEKLMGDIESTFGVRIGNTYGMGENIVHTRTSPKDSPEVIRTTVGRPVPGAELAIFSEDFSTELPAGEVGEVAFRGPSLFLGYFKNPEETAATRNSDGWFFTGDVGFVDADGYLHLAGRRKELINRGGTKIFPKEIEDLLVRHPKIAQAAVVGMPDYRLGERICAYVVPAEGDQPTLDEITAYLGGQGIMKNKYPERLEIVTEFPMTPTGKVLKRQLADEVRQKIEAEKPPGSAE